MLKLLYPPDRSGGSGCGGGALDRGTRLCVDSFVWAMACSSDCLQQALCGDVRWCVHSQQSVDHAPGRVRPRGSVLKGWRS
eukprot:14367550-Alexandrium_andersonii.AAC.1